MDSETLQKQIENLGFTQVTIEHGSITVRPNTNETQEREYFDKYVPKLQTLAAKNKLHCQPHEDADSHWQYDVITIFK